MKIIYILLAVLAAVSVSAQCNLGMNFDSTSQLIAQVPQLDAALKSCPQKLPFPVNLIAKDERVQLDVRLQNGGTQTIIFTTDGGFLKGASLAGSGTGWKITVTQCAFDTALRENDALGILSHAYKKGDLTVQASGWGKRMLWTSARPVVSVATSRLANAVPFVCSSSANPSVPTTQAPPPVVYTQPAGCTETYAAGHRGYAENQALWDSYTADSNGICQSNTPVSCKYNIQLSVSGTPYYLCWYDVAR